jgi:hypothetical protein
MGAFEEENADVTTTSIDAFDVFPNPGNGTFQVQLNESAENAQAELINMLGERVATFTFSGTAYNFTPTEHLAGGVYLLRINSNGNVYSKRLVVE